MANSQYYVTESGIASLLKLSGLPASFQNQFTQDYAALKRDTSDIGILISELTVRVDQSEVDILALDSRLGAAEGSIISLGSRLTTAEDNIATVTFNLNTHTSATSAHGAIGNIVGTNNYCTSVLGGTVLQASAVAAATASTVNMTQSANAAGVAYSQTDAATWVNELAEHKAGINQLKVDLNALITLFNQSLTTEQSAKQRA